MSDASAILEQLRTVAGERERRLADPDLSAKVQAIKHYQQERFCHTYSDLLGSSRYGPASQFFLEELYGPTDFSARDSQFARVVPALVRLFPKEVVSTVLTLARLHAMSERLDTLMGTHLAAAHSDAGEYVAAWQATGCVSEREQQIALTLDVAVSLDQLTRKPWVRNTLRLMRGPARTAGLSELQRFLEAGFEAFKAMGGAQQFIELIGERERALALTLFAATIGEKGRWDEVLTLLPTSA